MDKPCDIDLDLGKPLTVGQVFNRLHMAGGLPVVVIPLDTEHKPVEMGHGATTNNEFMDALRWAFNVTLAHIVRIVPVDHRQP